MSVRCPSCKMESPDGAAFCDFCKEPFVKKAPKPAAPDPLANIPKEKILELPAEHFLKADQPAVPVVPTWVRPVAWTFLALCLLGSFAALWMLQQRYQDRRDSSLPGPGGGVIGRP